MRGVFGDPKARVIRLNRRSKKRLTSQCGLVGLAGTDADRVIERAERFSGLMLGSLLRGYAFGDAFPNFRRSKARYQIGKTTLRTAN